MVDIKNLGRIQNIEDWQHAENLYRSGEPDKLARMLLSRTAIPRKQRTFLADLVQGNVKLPSMTGKKNAKLTYEQRARIHDLLWSLRRMHAFSKRNAEWHANEMKVEVGELMKLLAAQRTGFIDWLAQTYGVSKASIPKIAQRFKKVSPLPPAVSARIRKGR